MQRFNAMMLHGLRECGLEAELVRPPAVLGRIRAFGATAAKWLGYIDKFILFQWRLWRKLAARPALVHICDHSNATYARSARKFPLVITCHDLLAVRGGLGEDTDCPASFTGRVLQRWILRGLRRADIIACDSRATAQDAERLLAREGDRPRISLVHVGLNFPYRHLPNDVVDARLRTIADLKYEERFVLHVGSKDSAGRLLRRRRAVAPSCAARPVRWRTSRAQEPCCTSQTMKKILRPICCDSPIPKSAGAGVPRRSRTRSDFPPRA